MKDLLSKSNFLYAGSSKGFPIKNNLKIDNFCSYRDGIQICKAAYLYSKKIYDFLYVCCI